MPSVCFYFQVHQPYRLRHYSFFDIGHNHMYEDDEANKSIMLKVADKCYLPMNSLLLKLINQHKGNFRVSFSLSGVFIEQMVQYAPEVLKSFQELVDTGCVEILAETYAHSVSFLFSPREWMEQIALHDELVKTYFHVRPTAFRNTELIYNNDIAQMAEQMGYQAILTEGADQVINWRSPNFVYQPGNCRRIRLLLKNYRLSDDIAFRFSNQGWEEYPLTAEKYVSWLHSLNGQGETINLFMDYETFGEHQWASTGIFEFMEALPGLVLANPDFTFATPSQVAANCSPMARLDIPNFISWADAERDLSAWRGNDLQDDALGAVAALEEDVKKTEDPDLLRTWRRFTTSDHFYYMCTKFFSDGDVHKYFSPYETPYDAYIFYMNALADLELSVRHKLEEKKKVRRPKAKKSDAERAAAAFSPEVTTPRYEGAATPISGN
ncbi:MAG TPA: glycoside hydrolase family 57 protein [Candidatus Desulfovibrio intestinipullorum]|uniref:Glycoside hydrolase family 57 protein n=1 Tax=Candidatus Desulfovibrio intestinipullorum TaxID=2838536 RepID=A0A9D1TQ50_9BACT|nr:glycoside hydrolase family 57 protein [Candidatus Desulfovibrio intestinipullorum]